MHVRLLGTGSADRWPNPWCTCPRCDWARASGTHRARTSVLVDGHLLIDPGPDAGSAGTDLTEVRTVLITHDHPDHLDPAFLLAWTWAGAGTLTVAGPAEAIERCRPWVGPQSPVRFEALAAGDRLSAGPLQVHALPAAHSTLGGSEHDGSALLYDIRGDARVLYATDTAALPHEALGDLYDLVLLELTFGDVLDHGTAHLDLPTFGREVARLRSDARLSPGARVVAVHLSHHNPVDLPERLAAIGAEVLPDGSAIAVGSQSAVGSRSAVGSQSARARRLLVTGGARSGKSARAESLAAGRPLVTYVATAPAYPDDPEWAARIAAHRDRRPAAWRLRETADVAGVLRAADPEETVLVDCLTLWLTAVLDRAGGWQDDRAALAAAAEALEELVSALGATRADVVLVTNEVGSGIAPETSSGRLFRDLLGRVNAGVASVCDDVEIVTCGIPQVVKGASWTTST
jgi:adenosylcobinamide kinase/adenosylcobinamide-phosphate guanylyltransferase